MRVGLHPVVAQLQHTARPPACQAVAAASARAGSSWPGLPPTLGLMAASAASTLPAWSTTRRMEPRYMSMRALVRATTAPLVDTSAAGAGAARIRIAAGGLVAPTTRGHNISRLPCCTSNPPLLPLVARAQAHCWGAHLARCVPRRGWCRWRPRPGTRQSSGLSPWDLAPDDPLPTWRPTPAEQGGGQVRAAWVLPQRGVGSAAMRSSRLEPRMLHNGVIPGPSLLRLPHLHYQVVPLGGGPQLADAGARVCHGCWA